MNIQTQNFGEVELLNFTDLSESDVRYVLKMRNHPEIKKWMYNQEDIILTQHLGFIESLKTDSNKHYFIVKQAGIIIGTVNFTKIDQHKKMADIGLYVNPFEVKKGKGQLLEEVAVFYAKNTLKLIALNLEVFKSNERAIHFYNKIGFEYTGSRKVNNQIVFCMHKKFNQSE